MRKKKKSENMQKQKTKTKTNEVHVDLCPLLHVGQDRYMSEYIDHGAVIGLHGPNGKVSSRYYLIQRPKNVRRSDRKKPRGGLPA